MNPPPVNPNIKLVILSIVYDYQSYNINFDFPKSWLALDEIWENRVAKRMLTVIDRHPGVTS